MCSHKEITWRYVSNTVAHRMIDDSLMHKFIYPQKICKRTKLMNAEIRKRGIIKNYDEYMALKKLIIEKVPVDYDTEDSDILSDLDYSIIYSSESKLKQYRKKVFTSNVLINDKNKKISQTIKKMNDTTKFVKKRTKKSVDVRQQEDSISQICFYGNKDDDSKENQATSSTRKNNKTKSVEKNNKSVHMRQQKVISQPLFTSDEDDEEENQMISKAKKNDKAKLMKKNTKKSVNVEQQQDFIPQALFTSDANDNEKEMISQTKKNSKNKLVRKKRKSTNIGWQEVVKKNRGTTLVSDNREHTDTLNISKQNISHNDKHDDPEADFNKKFLCIKEKPQNDMASCSVIKSMSKDIPQNHSNPITTIPESDSQNVFRDTTQNHENSEAMVNKINSESNDQVNAVVRETDSEQKVMINGEDNVLQRKSDVKANESNSWILRISPNDEMHQSKLASSEILSSSPTNNLPSSISKKQPSVSKDRSCEKSIKMEEKSLINAKNYDTFVNPKSSELINNTKRNLTSIMDIVDCTPKVSSLDASHDQQKDSGIDEDSQDIFMKQINIENQNNAEEIVEKIFVQSKLAEADKVTEELQENYIKDTNLKVDKILKEKDTADEMKESETDSSELNQIEEKDEEKDVKVNDVTKTLKDLCDIQKKQLQPTVTSSEIVNKKYRIVFKKDNDVNVTCKDTEYNSSKFYTSMNSSNVSDDTSANMTNEIEAQEVEHEEDEEDDANMARCVSSQTKKQRQRLNLIIDSDSSDSENENGYRSIADPKNSKSHTDNSDTSRSIMKDKMKSKETDIAALHSADLREDVHLEFGNDESNGSKKSNAEISHSEDTRADKDNVSAKMGLINDKGYYISGERQNEAASLDDVGNEEGQHQKNVRYRPCNLEELVEDEGLLTETLPASLTLADISEDEEAFIMNIPDKLLQCNLQGQSFILKKNTIKFGKNKFQIVQNKMSTVSCVFGSGKQKKPYKLVNLKEVSTITIGEKLSHSAEDLAESNFQDVNISPKKSRRKHYTSR